MPEVLGVVRQVFTLFASVEPDDSEQMMSAPLAQMGLRVRPGASVMLTLDDDGQVLACRPTRQRSRKAL